MDTYVCYRTEPLEKLETPLGWHFKGIFNNHHCYIIPETIKFLNDLRTIKFPKRTASPTIPPTIPPSLVADIQQVVRGMYPDPSPPPDGLDGVLFLAALMITLALLFFKMQCDDRKKQVAIIERDDAKSEQPLLNQQC